MHAGAFFVYSESLAAKHSGQTACRLARLCFNDAKLYEQVGRIANTGRIAGVRKHGAIRRAFMGGDARASGYESVNKGKTA